VVHGLDLGDDGFGEVEGGDEGEGVEEGCVGGPVVGGTEDAELIVRVRGVGGEVQGNDVDELDGEPGLGGAEEDVGGRDEGDVVGFRGWVGGGMEGDCVAWKWR
jgi:hypothetical protein